MNQEKIVKSEEEWKRELTSEQYHVMRQKGTERVGTFAATDTNSKIRT